MLCAPLDWQYAELPSLASDAVLCTDLNLSYILLSDADCSSCISFNKRFMIYSYTREVLTKIILNII